MNKANECTCPSGDGSLRHPCPAHPAPAEQAGGDERDLQGAQGERDGWGPLPIVQVPWNVFDRAVMWVEDRRRYGDNGTIVDDWKALKTIQRAALAQPSPKCSTCNDRGHVCIDWEAGAWEKCPDCAQAEAERPEVVAWMHDQPNRVDVIHRDVKELLQRVPGSNRGIHRPLDVSEHYTIPLYAAPAAQAQHSVPDGYRLIRLEHFAAIKAQLNPEQVDAYRGRNIYDEDKVYANWNACRSALDEIKDVFQQIDWYAENELAELLAAAPGKEGV